MNPVELIEKAVQDATARVADAELDRDAAKTRLDRYQAEYEKTVAIRDAWQAALDAVRPASNQTVWPPVTYSESFTYLGRGTTHGVRHRLGTRDVKTTVQYEPGDPVHGFEVPARVDIVSADTLKISVLDPRVIEGDKLVVMVMRATD